LILGLGMTVARPKPGQQGSGGQPGLVEREAVAGNLPITVSLPVRTQSSTRACTRRAASM
jgi:hypothetical protein